LKTLILGIIQGITEFLPISSSGHLVISEKLLGFDPPSIFFEILVHLGTLIAILIVFHKDIIKIKLNAWQWIKDGFTTTKMDDDAKTDLRMVLFIIIACIPTAIIGLVFKDQIEAIFHSAKLVGFTLIFTGFILIMSKVNQDRCYKKIKDMSGIEAFLIGIVQGIAILPGISRSGITISLGMMQKIDRQLAAKFSFYISIPAILGAVALKAFDITQADLAGFTVMIPGFLASIITGIFAIKLLLKHIQKGAFYMYSIWCFLMGILTLVFIN